MDSRTTRKKCNVLIMWNHKYQIDKQETNARYLSN
jgi:hypothetical protein